MVKPKGYKNKNRKRAGGIWVSNKFDKPTTYRKIEGGRIKPLVKLCMRCKKRRVKYHHRFCNICYKIIQEEKNEKVKNG